MDIETRDTLIAQAEAKYLLSLQTAKQERSDALDTIQRLWDILQDKYDVEVVETSQIPIETLPAKKNNVKTYGTLTGAVKNVIEKVPRRFTRHDIKRALDKWYGIEKCNENSLSGILTRLQKKKTIEVVKKGKGRRPTRYRKGDANLFNRA